MNRRLALALAAALAIVVVAVVALAASGGGSDEPSDDDAESVALGYMEALDNQDYGAMWDHASSYEREGRSRQEYIDYWEDDVPCPEPCSPNTVPEGTTYEVTYVHHDDPWVRVGIRRTRPDRDQPEDEEVALALEDGTYGAVEAGPQGFDPTE